MAMSQPHLPSSFSSLCMPLSKFSFATSAGNSSGPIPWIHLNNVENLFATFELTSTRTSTDETELMYRFRVLRDPEVLEDINLNILASEAQRAMLQPQANGAASRNPAITVVVKCPRIAIRYPSNGSQVRRFQVSFSKVEDFYEAMKILSQSKVPITEAEVGATSARLPPAEYPSRGLRMPDSNHHTAQLGPRPATAPYLSDLRPSPYLVPDVYSACPQRSNHLNLVAVDQSVHQSDNGYTTSTLARPGYQHYSTTPCVNTTTRSEAGLNYGVRPPTADEGFGISQFTSPFVNFSPLRPSTAPTKSFREPDDDLPPRRDLPFLSSPTKTASKGHHHMNESSSQPTPQTKSTSIPTPRKVITSPRPPAISLDFCPKKISEEFFEKQQASKAKNKGKAVTRSDHTAPSPQTQNTKVAIASENASSQPQPVLSGQDIDTQALLKKAQAKQKKRPNGTSSDVHTTLQDGDVHSLSSQVKVQNKRKCGTKCQPCRNKRRKCIPNENDPLADCQNCERLGQICSFNATHSVENKSQTAESQIVQVKDSQDGKKTKEPAEDDLEILPPASATPRPTKAEISQTSFPSKIAESPQTTCSEFQLSPAPETETIVDLDERSSNNVGGTKRADQVEHIGIASKEKQNSSNEPTKSCVDAGQTTSALLLLLQDPNFVKSGLPELAGKCFSELSDREQDAVLRTYVVNVLDDENFVNLCKRLAPIWERMFLKL